MLKSKDGNFCDILAKKRRCYWTFRNLEIIALKPSEVELHYLKSIKDLEMIGTRQN